MTRSSSNNRRIVAFCSLFLALSLAQASHADYTPVNFSTYFNVRYQDLQPDSADLPEGNLTLGGVPFQIPAGGMNAWWGAQVPPDPGLKFIDIPVNIFDATAVHTLINTSYGRPAPEVWAYVEFFGTNGAYYRKDLLGNVDIRDHYQSAWTNSINNTTTINVALSSSGNSRIDKQFIQLPGAFAGQTLQTIRVNDLGGTLIQDVILAGVTVQSNASAPEPGSLALMGISILVAIPLARLRRPNRVS